ncbi:sialidase-1 [Pedobacter steynii]|uniref:Sialidase-1 n=1 Tax=Pedobacter steynii TaxID=430522 RepID=A0A1H0CY62_9SPHI|nr:SGNH/GDSL hydrolase family protein [Pedobacter steynii]NQX41692.1 SGNH/GDSL hydrolase family protein [Pedobacter steynii]SDN62571.1 sialidase-1 [Pedobacter steynii]
MIKRLLFFLSAGLCFLNDVEGQVTPLDNRHYISSRKGLPNAFRAFNHQKSATVAFLGGSITNAPGWRDSVCNTLRERFPNTSFHFIAAGIPSLGSLPHAFRLQRDVLDSGKVDLLFLEAAVNDEVNGTDSLTQLRSLEGIVRHARLHQPNMDIVLMSFADPDKTRAYNEGKTPVSIANHERIASHYGLPSINLAKEVRDRMENKEFSWEKDFKDLHPSPFGQGVYAKTIRTMLSLNFEDAALMAGKKAKVSSLPKPMIKGNFEHGHYQDIATAKYSDGWKLEGDWTPADGLGTRKGFVHVPMLIANSPAATLTLNFKGNAVGMSVISGADAGIVTYSIDNGPEKDLDLYTQWSKSLHLPWYVLFGSDLKEGNHILKLRISDHKNEKSIGNACRIVHFLVN